MSEFNPNDHLTKLKGVPYLEVKWRMAWLRDKHPDAVIETDMVSMNDTHAIFKATVSIPGGGSATGWGSETPGDFRDYIEKAETKALGRALAALGFGTQFAPDVDDGSANDRPVDAPVARSQAPRRDEPRTPASSGQRTEQGLTPRQREFIFAIARELGLSVEQIEAESSQSFSKSIGNLNRRDASIFIERLQQRRAEVIAGRSPQPTAQGGPPDPPEPDEYEEVAMFNAAHADRFTN